PSSCLRAAFGSPPSRPPYRYLPNPQHSPPAAVQIASCAPGGISGRSTSGGRRAINASAEPLASSAGVAASPARLNPSPDVLAGPDRERRRCGSPEPLSSESPGVAAVDVPAAADGVQLGVGEL